MATPKDNRKAAFSVLGEVVFTEGKKKIQIKNTEYYQLLVSRLAVGKKVALTVEEYVATKSQAQHNYYWALIGYLSDFSGHEPTELHDAIMRRKFGTKQIVVGDLVETVRKSISDAAKFPKGDMSELIEETLELCNKLGIVVPTKEELGYLPS